MDPRYQLSSYDYHLPEKLIAQQPTAERDQSRLLLLNPAKEMLEDRHFTDIVDLVRPGDLLVVNNSRVFPARLHGRKQTGGRVEMLLLHFPEPKQESPKMVQRATALTLIKSSKRPKIGSIISFTKTLEAEIEYIQPDGKVGVTLLYPAGSDLEQLLQQYGEMPLPPYIKRPEGCRKSDSSRYQTKYSCRTGSVAAPTAGLHFSDLVMEQVRSRGVARAAVTLHVGYGTFAPVRCDDIRKHRIHEEFIEISEETCQTVNATRAAGGRIWAVGTTSVRTLEFAADEDGIVHPYKGLCGFYIYPGYRFKVVDNLITNFHLPKSSLLFLVSALAGRKRILSAYDHAVKQGYRFFSYGDAMAIICKERESE